MGFWIFVLIMDLLIPFTMIGFSKSFLNVAPKEINAIFGYVCGLIMLPLSVIAMIVVLGKGEDTVETVGGIIEGIQMLPLVGPIFLTEGALKKTFDKRGNRP